MQLLKIITPLRKAVTYSKKSTLCLCINFKTLVMTWLWILIGIVVVVYIFSLLSGASKEDSASNAAGAAIAGGSCMLQIFLSAIGIIIILGVFRFLFG